MCMKRKNDVNRLCVYAIIFFTVFLSGYCFSENLEEAWKQAVQSNHSLMATYQDIDAASYSLKAADRYREGLSTNPEVLDAETLRAKSHNNYDNAVYDFFLATLRLRRAVENL